MKKVTRLYEQFKPTHYIIDLVPDREGMTFSGSVVISGQKVGRPSQRLTFHQKDLNIDKVRVVLHEKAGDKEVVIDRINRQNSFDEVRLHAKHMLYPGKYTITIEFSGQITRAMNGIYPCFFKHDDVEKKLIATQFESHHAREVFPCVDEPEAKVTFDLILTTPKGETVIANTPVKTQTEVDNMVRSEFETTPHMSTYLLAFVYGELGYKEAKTKKGVVVRTYATPDNVEFTAFALDVAVQCLDFYSEYFDIDYPLEKCDMIALPDFASGAMENWGCITYREQTLLVDPKNTSLGMKQYVAMVVAHELTHQWFGNLVTMRWWTDLWLNEGFASWFEYLAVDKLFPNWKMWTQFIVDEQQPALRLDSLEHTHPVEVSIGHPDEIRTIFDNISYGKGASVIHMLYHYLGADDFQGGLRYYLKTHAYKNTDTADLWSALEEISKKPVSEFMAAWTSQSGYPIVEVDATDAGLTLQQRRFVLNPKSEANNDNVTWPIPLLATDEKLPVSFSEPRIQLPNDEPGSFKLNQGGSGFYRTVYNASHLQALAKQIKTGHLNELDRLGVLADVAEAAKAGRLDAAEVLNVMAAYHDEEDNAVWDVMATTLGSIRSVMDDDDVREAMKPYVRKLTTKQVKRLGWEAQPHESHFDRLLRPTILGMAAASDAPDIVAYAQEQFAEMHDPSDLSSTLKGAGDRQSLRANNLDPDLRGVVYSTVARTGGDAEFNKLLAMHNNTHSNEEKLNLCAALTGFKQPELVDRALDLIRSEHVRLQDVAYWLAYSFTNRFAREKAWKWLQKNWGWLDDNLGNDLAFYRMPVYVARGFSDSAFLPEYKKFFMGHMSTAIERSFNQGVEMIEWQSEWKKRDLKLVKAFFKDA